MTNNDTDMKNGVCPKCGSTEVCVQPMKWRRLDRRNFISTSWWGGGAKVQNYACIECGYLENYIDPADLDKVAAKWNRVSQTESVE